MPTTMQDSLQTRRSPRRTLDREHTRRFVEEVFAPANLHAARLLSLANAAVGVLEAAVLSVHAIGRAFAQVANIRAKSGVKQVDRLLSNDGLPMSTLLRSWVQFVVGDSGSIVIALDWTDFEPDDHTTLCAYMVTRHGRAMPLAWKTVRKSQLKDKQTGHELEMVEQLESWLPPSVKVTVLADRGFGNQELYTLLEGLGWDYVIRFRGNIVVTSAEGERREADGWVAPNGRATKLVSPSVTNDLTQIPAVVTVRAKRMKEAWHLATSLRDRSASDIVKLYGRRFTIEEAFRDTKDIHFGMGLSSTHIRDANRRDRLLLLVAVAQSLLTLLGAASEASGLDKSLKSNTVKHRTMSLFNQGLYWYQCIPTMREEWLVPLVTEFERIVREHAFFSHYFGLETRG